MEKLFISCPMRARTAEQIHATMDQMHKIAEAIFGEELEVIPTYFEGTPPENANDRLWYLGKSIEKMSEADCFIGMLKRITQKLERMVCMMAKLWAQEIMYAETMEEAKALYERCPRLLKEKVKAILVKSGFEEITQE